MEHQEVLDCRRLRTGELKEYCNLSENEYASVAQIWIINDNNEILIQKRSLEKDYNPGVWSVTSGAVKAGEQSIDAAIREVSEELGLPTTKEEFTLMGSIKEEKLFIDFWLIKKNIKLGHIIIQVEELSEIKWIAINELEELMKQEFVLASGFKIYKEYISKNKA